MRVRNIITTLFIAAISVFVLWLSDNYLFKDCNRFVYLIFQLIVFIIANYFINRYRK